MTYILIVAVLLASALLWAAMAVSARISDDLEAQDAEEDDGW